MKILHINNNLEAHGAEMLIHNLVLLQKKNGLDVSVLILSDSNTFLKKDLLDNGIPVFSLDREGLNGRNPFYIFKIIPYLKKFDVIHVHLFPAQYWTFFAKVISFSKTPMITTEHSTTNNRRGNPFLHIIDKVVYRKGYKTVVACADAALKTLNEYSPNSNNISISNSVDVNRFHDAEPYSKKDRFGLNEDDFVITMVARFHAPKQQHLLIRALEKLPLNVHAVFCGDGDEMDVCKSLAVSLDVFNRVHFLGLCKDIDRILKSSDVIALLSGYEGLSLASIEGMSVGKPFIGSKVNGLEPIVRGAGVLVENNEQDIAEAIKKLLSDKDYYNKIIGTCWERAKQYDIYTMEKKYKAVYEKACSSCS